MNPKGELKILEMNLSGADLIVGSSQLYKYDMVRDLSEQGVEFEGGAATAHKSGGMREYLSRHISGGRNYALIDGSVSLESQFNKTSIIFNYMHPGKGAPVYLQAKSVSSIYHSPGEPALKYPNSKKIKVEDLDRVVKEEGVRYAPVPLKFHEIFRTRTSAPAAASQKTSGAGDKTPAAVPKKLNEVRGKESGWEELFSGDYKPNFSLSKDMKSPKIVLGAFENFPLDKLEETFVYPRHQRRVSKKHVLKMAESMARGDFFDNVINVRRVGKRWEVEDGKQTLHSVRFLRDKLGLTHYNLYTKEILDGTPVKITKSSNLNRPPSASDKSNMDDDGSIPFYRGLGDWLSHYSKNGSLTFIDMGRAHVYATEGRVRVSNNEVLAKIYGIKPSEVGRAREFLDTAMGGLGEDGVFMKRKAVVANLYKVFLDRKMKKDQLANVVGVVKKDRGAFALSRGSSAEEYDKLYKIIFLDSKKVMG
jgi:hypothetical protein